MCGIAGEIRFDNQPVDAGGLSAMAAAMVPRGPDANGILVRGNIGFAHRRLRIIDLSDSAQQPMIDSALGLSIIYNGAIYNYRELREELVAKGYSFFSNGDTEVLLKAYHAWGPDFVERLHGMFAFAIWERGSGRVVIVRDRLGIKPLYLAEGPGHLRFASTLPALLAAGDVDTDIDPVALHHYMHFHAVVPAPLTMLKGVRKLPPATILLFTISEEIGSGASAVLHGDVSEMVSVDNGTVAPGQASQETGVTVSMADMVGPFDYHLTNKLIDLCADFDVPFQRDIFRYYRSDSASAIEAGSDIRTALVCVGVDASHGYERTHTNAILSVAQLLSLYMQSPPTAKRDVKTLADIEGFTEQPTEEIIASFGKVE
jgi:hypothetical protein